MEQKLSIAKIIVKVLTENTIKPSDAYAPFFCNSEKLYHWRILFKKTKELKDGKYLYKDVDYKVDENFNRYYFDSLNDNQLYAITCVDIKMRQVVVEYLEEKEKFFKEWNQIFFHMGWEKLLALEDVIPFHAACIRTTYGGILFSGRSGIGKSTQADLWCKYEGSSLINGDRPLIGKNPDRGGYLAYGSPYAGSSKCYKNESCKIHSIVFLQQSPVCSIRKLKPSEAFQKIYSQTTLYTWDREYMEHACSVIEKLLETITVYELSCTPDEEAVKLLKETLEHETTS